MANNPTITITTLPDHNALKMTWAEHIERSDVARAFDEVLAVLEIADAPVHILVDITHNLTCPVVTTVLSARPIFQHSQLGAWLMVGENTSARQVMGLLTTMTARNNVHWFPSEADALAYLESPE